MNSYLANSFVQGVTDTLRAGQPDSAPWTVRLLGDTLDNWLTVLLTAILVAITAYYARRGHGLQRALHDLEQKRDQEARATASEKRQVADARLAAAAYAVRASLAPLDAEAIIVKSKGRQLPAFARLFRGQVQALLTSLMHASADATEGSATLRSRLNVGVVALARAKGTLDFIDLFSRIDVDESDAKGAAVRDELVAGSFKTLTEQLHACHEVLGKALTPELLSAEEEYKKGAQIDSQPMSRL